MKRLFNDRIVCHQPYDLERVALLLAHFPELTLTVVETRAANANPGWTVDIYASPKPIYRCTGGWRKKIVSVLIWPTER